MPPKDNYDDIAMPYGIPAYYSGVKKRSADEFTGVPLAVLSRGNWYWPTRKTAEQFAKAFGLPTSFIEAHAEGWAIRMEIDGSYVGGIS